MQIDLLSLQHSFFYRISTHLNEIHLIYFPKIKGLQMILDYNNLVCWSMIAIYNLKVAELLVSFI